METSAFILLGFEVSENEYTREELRQQLNEIKCGDLILTKAGEYGTPHGEIRIGKLIHLTEEPWKMEFRDLFNSSFVYSAQQKLAPSKKIYLYAGVYNG